MYIIHNWKVIRHALPDGVVIVCLYGEVYGNPRFKPGGPISTSAVESYRSESDSVTTVNGSEYQLGKPDPAAPFAKQRLIRYLEQHSKGPQSDDFSSTTDQTNIGTKDELAP
jgi:hypothetical protein